MLIKTRCSATAEKQRVSYSHVFLGWLTDRAIHCTSQLLCNTIAKVVSKKTPPPAKMKNCFIYYFNYLLFEF